MDLQKLVATTFTYMGGTLTLENGSTVVGQLLFSGTYTPAEFALNRTGMAGRMCCSCRHRLSVPAIWRRRAIWATWMDRNTVTRWGGMANGTAQCLG